MNKTTKEKCTNCALCSYWYPSNEVKCDFDDHKINNECEEGCEKNFIEIEVDENLD